MVFALNKPYFVHFVNFYAIIFLILTIGRFLETEVFDLIYFSGACPNIFFEKCLKLFDLAIWVNFLSVCTHL